MSGYIIKGLVDNGFPASHIIATRRTLESLNMLKRETGVQITTDNVQAVERADIVVMGVKPNVMKPVTTSLAGILQQKRPLLISIAAGLRLDSIENWGGGNLPTVRVMPNLPVAIQQGTSSLYANERVSDEQKSLVNTIFSPISLLCWMKEESHIDVATALAGSGPAYFYRFVEALAEGAEALGLNQETAKKMALHTGLGALELLKQSGDDPAVMRERVTSPGGTTAAALDTFNQLGLHNITKEALIAAVDRSKALAKCE